MYYVQPVELADGCRTTYETQEQTVDPLVPTPLDGVLMAVWITALFLAGAAFISLMRRASTSGRRLLAWVIVVLFVPILGPAAWFIARRRGRPVRSDSGGFGS